MRIITSPWRTEFNTLVGTAKNYLRVVAPFYTDEPVAEILRRGKSSRKYFLFALNAEGVSGSSQSVSAIRAIKKATNAEVRFIRGLHAKFIIADERAAIVTSANLTHGGLEKNFEMGVRFEDPKAVKTLARHFDALWSKAQPITESELADFDAVRRKENGRVKGPKDFGTHVRLGKLPKRPPAPDTPVPGWILVHSEQAYQADPNWESPIEQLENCWEEREGELSWSWTSPKLKGSAVPRRLLFAWRGEVFGHATATVEEASPADKKKGYPYFFILTDLKWAKPYVSFYDLPLGRRRRHHRGLIRLDERILAAYEKKQK